jgi:4-diphosphocytidyl-2-C-methyl-D-erythritol kinase
MTSSSASVSRSAAKGGLAAGSVRERARAKVNLTLHIKGKRQDGYHELESLVVFAGVSDELVFSPASDDSLELHGPFAGLVDGENLVLKAKRAVAFWLGVEIRGHFRLEKNIPVAAGLGGGSSDAAAAIRALLHAFDRASDERRFIAQSAKIGADVPVCLQNSAAWMCGLGERVTPVTGLAALPAILVNPRIKLATAAVFKTLNAPPLPPAAEQAPPPALAPWKDPEGAAAYLLDGSNDLEPPAIALEPAVATVLDTLLSLDGCLLSRLSGSGPTCFGLFRSQEAAAKAAATLAQTHPNWWVAATVLS